VFYCDRIVYNSAEKVDAVATFFWILKLVLRSSALRWADDRPI